MNLFVCCLLCGIVSVISSEVMTVCESISSSDFDKNGGETNSKKLFLIYKEMQNSKGDVGQKGDKGNNGSTGTKGTKGDTGVINMTEINEMKLQLELGEFYGRNFFLITIN